MSVSDRVGDLFSAGLPAIGHGCNCAGAMGKGIAVEFRRRWPAMFEEYKRRCAAGTFALGDLFAWEASDQVVFNLGTQQTWRTRAQVWAIDSSVRKMIQWAEERSIPQVGLPRIGAGLGGLSWPAVAQAIHAVAGQSPVELVIFEFHVALLDCADDAPLCRRK